MGTVYSAVNGEIITKTQDVIEKEREYSKYIIEHCQNVIKAFTMIFCNEKKYIPDGYTIEEYEDAINKLKYDINLHDRSKFLPEEFYAYRVKFHPTDNEKKRMEEDIDFLNKVKEDFDKAWEHHYKNNDHHTRYWLVPNQQDKGFHYTDMPLHAILHMICDWCAMSIKFDGDAVKVVDWYNNKADKEKSEMTEKTKSTVEELLKMIFNAEIK